MAIISLMIVSCQSYMAIISHVLISCQSYMSIISRILISCQSLMAIISHILISCQSLMTIISLIMISFQYFMAVISHIMVSCQSFMASISLITIRINLWSIHKLFSSYSYVTVFPCVFLYLFQNKQFIYRGDECLKLATIINHLTAEFPQAQILSNNDPQMDAIKEGEQQCIL